jgi:hypothetical protein
MSVVFYLRWIDDESIYRLAATREDIGERLFPEVEKAPGEHVSLEKSWGEINCLLEWCEDDDRVPADFLMHGGVRLGIGELSAKAFASHEVRELARFVESIDEAKIREYCARRFATLTFDQFSTWVLPQFQQMREFLRQAATHQKGILVYGSF